jgi:hypothetical protein
MWSRPTAVLISCRRFFSLAERGMNRSLAGGGQAEESMRVLVRVRPPESNDSNELLNSTSTSLSNGGCGQSSFVIDETEKKISLTRDRNKGSAEFSFSHVLGMQANQKDLFALCSDTINDVTAGINCAILAYGQTGE